MKIRPVGAKLFRADRRRDMTKLLVAFCNFANAHKKIGKDVRNTFKTTAVFAQRSNSRGCRV